MVNAAASAPPAPHDALERAAEVSLCIEEIATLLAIAAFYRAASGPCPKFGDLDHTVRETFRQHARVAIARTSAAATREAMTAARVIAREHTLDDAITAYHHSLNEHFERQPLLTESA